MNAPDPQNETRAKPGRGLFDELGTTVRELFDFTRRLLSDGNSRRLVIYNPQGRLLRTLLDGPCDAGYHSTVWDGRDSQGHRAGSGVYLIRMRAGSYATTSKVVMLK